MKQPIKSLLFALILLSTALAACSPVAVPTVAAQPTDDPGALLATANALGTQVAATIMAGLTQTALANPPTATPEPPTATPTLEPSLTPLPPTSTAVPTIFIPTSTRIIVLPSATATQGPYQCQVTAQSPSQWAIFPPGADYDARWTIKNVGTKDWPKGEVDLYFISGEAMQKRGDAFDLNDGVDTGDTASFVVDMVAPRTNGYYTATWGVRYNGTLMCSMKVEITVR